MTETTSILAPGTHTKPPIVVLRERLEARKGELQNALTDVSPDVFIRALTTAAQINPELQSCSFSSIWNACMKACRDNLLPDGREGAIVPFKNNAQWIPMYQGLLKRFRQSGMAKWITADVVREGEVFEHWVDERGEHFKHIPQGDETKPITAVYAAALTGGDSAFYVCVMSVSEINKIKNQSRASRDDSPWKQWPGEMMKKTALRRLSKMLPAGRDFFEEEEEPQATPAQPMIQIVERQAGAASALDQFAGTAKEPSQPEGGEVSRPADPADNYLSTAYERGKVAKQTGLQRRAVPGEYRDEARKAELNAWLAGYDGKEFEATGEANGENAN